MFVGFVLLTECLFCLLALLALTCCLFDVVCCGSGFRLCWLYCRFFVLFCLLVCCVFLI